MTADKTEGAKPAGGVLLATVSALALGAALATAQAGPAAAQGAFGGSSVVVNQSVLDSLGPDPNSPGGAGVYGTSPETPYGIPPAARSGSAPPPVNLNIPASPYAGQLAFPPQDEPRSRLLVEPQAAAPASPPTQATAAPRSLSPAPPAPEPAAEPAAEPAVQAPTVESPPGESVAAPEPAAAAPVPEPSASAPEPEPTAPEPAMPEPMTAEPEPLSEEEPPPAMAATPEPAASPSDPEPAERETVVAAAPEPEPEPEPAAEPGAAAASPEPAAEPQAVTEQASEPAAAPQLPDAAQSPLVAERTENDTQTAALPSGAGVPGDLRLEFAGDSAELDEPMRDRLLELARQLRGDESLRIQLMAYAAGEGGDASRARRLSLSRALAVRSFLLDQGVRSTRMDVRALGHNVPDGPPDRVDIVSSAS